MNEAFICHIIIRDAVYVHVIGEVQMRRVICVADMSMVHPVASGHNQGKASQ
ncbi:MAG: hypothetical protein ABJG95_22040 [Rhizobiaceae bacterium]